MKKLILLVITIFVTVLLFAQDCSDIIISEYVEGWSNNKAIELYNPTPDPITLNPDYRLIRWSNGSEVADQDIKYVLPLEGTIDPYDVMVIIQDTTFPGQDSMIYLELRNKADWLAPADYEAGTQGCRVVFWNGDDAISIQKFDGQNWIDIDIFGEIGVRPLNWQGTTSPTGAWDDTPPYADGQGAYLTKDQTLVRHSDVLHGVDRQTMNGYGPNSFYAFAEYDSLPVNFFDSLGSHRCNCKPASVGEIMKEVEVKFYPNPVSQQKFTVLASADIMAVEVINIVGQSVYYRENTHGNREMKVELGDVKCGMYLVKIYLTNEQYLLKKIIVK
ncbi:MAG: lamin tail domain-containing protein [Bacteroidetes bacterium]|nr:lamin tail domain-containing protein [Bacteroidota bacterium]